MIEGFGFYVFLLFFAIATLSCLRSLRDAERVVDIHLVKYKYLFIVQKIR